MNLQYILKLDNQTIIKIYVQPGSSVNEVVGLYGEPPRLKIKIKSPPTDGEANVELIAFISKKLGISKSRVHLDKGLTSRKKDLLIDLRIEDVAACFYIK